MLEKWIEQLDSEFCLELISVGQGLCEDWGMSFEEMYEKTFTSLTGTIKLAFMLAMALPAFAEVVLEWGTLVLGTVVELFPALLGDAFEIIMWIVTSSSVLQLLEPLLDSFDPLLDELTQGLEAVASSNNGCGSKTVEKQSTAAWNPSPPLPDGATIEIPEPSSLDEQMCKPSGPSTCNPGLGTLDPVDGGAINPVDMSPRSTEEKLANCGCVPKPLECDSSSRGGAACKFQMGDYEVATTRNPDSTSNGCPKSRILTGGVSDAQLTGELLNLQGDGTCTVTPRKTRATVSESTPKMFEDFSSSTGWHKQDDNRVVLNHFRNLLSTPVVDAPAPLGGFRLLISRGGDGEVHFQRETKELRQAVHNLTNSYETLVAILPPLSVWGEHFENTTRAVVVAGRTLLQLGVANDPNIPDDDLDRMQCSANAMVQQFDSVTNNPVTMIPSTYGCCRGLWCCLRPLPRNFRFKGEWFRWREWWYTDTLCPWIDGYDKAILYFIRAPLKLLYDGTSTISHWPFGLLIDPLYGAIGFTDGEWPEKDATVHAACLVFNSGFLWMPLFLALTLALVLPAATDFFEGGAFLVEDTIVANLEFVAYLRGRTPLTHNDKGIAQKKDF
jgi:hypothetical protein